MIAWSVSMPREEMAVVIESSMAFNVHLFGTWIVEYVFASDRRESEVRCGDNRSRALGRLHQKLEVYQ